MTRIGLVPRLGAARVSGFPDERERLGDRTRVRSAGAGILSKSVAQIYDFVFRRLKDQVIPSSRTADRYCVMLRGESLPKLDRPRIYRMNVARDNIGSLCGEYEFSRFVR